MADKFGIAVFALALATLFVAVPDMARSEGQGPSATDRATARARIDTLRGGFDAAIKRAKGEQEGAGRTSGKEQAAHCERFQRELRTAQSHLSEIYDLESIAYQEHGGFEPLRLQLEELDEGCPRGTFFEPKTKPAQQFRQDLAVTVQQVQQAIRKSDDIAFQARKADLNNLIERGQSLGREEKDPNARLEIQRLTSAAQRIQGDLPQRAERIRIQIQTPGLPPPILPPPVTTPPPGPTGPQLPVPQGGSRPLSFSMDFGGAFFNAPTTSFLGVQNPVTLERQQLRFESDRTDLGQQFSGSMSFGGIPNPFGGGAGRLTFGGSFASFSQSTFVRSFDPGSNNLLIIGTGVDPFGPGFSVPPGGGTFNDLENFRYSRDISRFGFSTQYNMPLSAADRLVEAWGSSRVSAVVRIAYTRTSIEETQSATLPNVPLDIHNRVDLRVNTFTPAAGLRITLPGSPDVKLVVQAWVGPAFSNASGSDNFTFSGLFNGTQQNPLSDTHVGFAWHIESGMTVRLNNAFSLAVNGFYGQSNSHPTIVRTGEAGERSRIKWETEDGFGAIFRIQRNFGN